MKGTRAGAQTKWKEKLIYSDEQTSLKVSLKRKYIIVFHETNSHFSFDDVHALHYSREENYFLKIYNTRDVWSAALSYVP